MSLIMVGAGVLVAGTAVSAYGTYQAGQAQKAMGKYNADLAKNEAITHLMHFWPLFVKFKSDLFTQYLVI